MDDQERVEDRPAVPGPGDAAEPAKATEPVGAEEERKPRRSRRQRPLWWRVLRMTVFGVTLGLVLVILFLTQTARGQRLVLDEILQQARAYLAG
jgi:hypothetical protein